MALLFSAVTVTAGYDEAEFTVGGIPREYDDLVGWTAFDDFMENVDAETEVSVHAEVYLYGGEETVTATPEEVAYLNYGKEGAEIIVDNTQDTIFGGFAPNSSSAETLSKALGSRTVMSGSVSRSKNDPSQSLQMIERPLLTPDELKSLPKGDFIVMKTGVHPMRVHLKLFFKWGIEFDDEHPYTVPDQGNREVKYADKKEIQNGILEKYPPEWKEETPAPNSSDGGGQAQQDSPKNEPQRTPPKDKNRGGKPIRTSPPRKETAPDITEAEIIKDLTETEVQSNEPS